MRPPAIRWLAHAAALFILVLLPPFAFWSLLTPNPSDQRSIATGDFTEVHYPLHAIVVSAWQQHQLPLWSVNVNAGHPAFADIQFDAFYPPTVLTGLLLGPSGRFSPALLVEDEVAHVFLAELGMYVLLLWLLGPGRAKRVQAAVPAHAAASIERIPAALTGAAVFAFSGYLTTYPLQDTDILQVSVWLPWAILLLDVALACRSTAWAVVAALPVGLAVLAGHPQVLLYVICAHLLYTLVFAAECASHGFRPALGAVGRGLLALGVGLATGAIQLLPTWQLAPLSVRANEGYGFLSGGFAPHELTGLVLRQGFGGAAPLYLGVVPLTLAVAGLATRVAGLRTYALALGGAGLLLSLGGQSALYPLAYLAVPGFDQVRDQERAIYLVTFSVALLAAAGVPMLYRPATTGSRWLMARLPVGLGATLLFGAAVSALLAAEMRPDLTEQARQSLQADLDGLDWMLLLLAALLVTALMLRFSRRHGVVLPWMLAGLCALDLLSAHPAYGTQAGAANPFPPSPLIRMVAADTDRPFRVSSEGLLPADGNEGLIYGLDDVVGSTPLELSAFEAINAAERSHAITELQRFALLDVRYVFTKRTFPPGAPLRLLGSDGDVHLYRLEAPYAFPPAWLVHKITTADDASTWQAVGQADLHQTAVLPTGVSVALAPASDDSVTLLASAPTRLAWEVTSDGTGLLVMSQIRYPGWTVTVDGRTAQLLPADGALLAVAVPAGRHAVVLAFAPCILRVGGSISLGALVLVGVAVGALLLGGRRRELAKPDVQERPTRP